MFQSTLTKRQVTLLTNHKPSQSKIRLGKIPVSIRKQLK